MELSKLQHAAVICSGNLICGRDHPGILYHYRDYCIAHPGTLNYKRDYCIAPSAAGMPTLVDLVQAGGACCFVSSNRAVQAMA
jgi:hypothetical protein